MSSITKDMALAISHLMAGEVVAIPTETVYGLAGNANDPKAISKIYDLKQRPLNHPLIMHIGQNWDLKSWASLIPDYIQPLINHFWPGPLTLVLNSKPDSVSPLITGGQQTVAIRCPAHPVAQSLLSELQFPLVAPSANPFGKISPTTAAHVQNSFKDAPLLILDGGRCEIGIESTIIDATQADTYQILRPGMIDEQTLNMVLPGLSRKQENNSIRVPGKLASHYQPEKPLYCFQDSQKLEKFCQDNPNVYVLTLSKPLQNFKTYSGYQLPHSPQLFAYELYYQLRLADATPARFIVLELPPDSEPWLGIRERLLKAATSVI